MLAIQRSAIDSHATALHGRREHIRQLRLHLLAQSAGGLLYAARDRVEFGNVLIHLGDPRCARRAQRSGAAGCRRREAITLTRRLLSAVNREIEQVVCERGLGRVFRDLLLRRDLRAWRECVRVCEPRLRIKNTSANALK